MPVTVGSADGSDRAWRAVSVHGSHDELIAKKGKYYQLYTGNLAEN